MLDEHLATVCHLNGSRISAITTYCPMLTWSTRSSSEPRRPQTQRPAYCSSAYGASRSNAISFSPDVSSRNFACDGAVCGPINKRIVAAHKDQLRNTRKALQHICNHATVDAAAIVDRAPWGFSSKDDSELKSSKCAVDLQQLISIKNFIPCSR